MTHEPGGMDHALEVKVGGLVDIAQCCTKSHIQRRQACQRIGHGMG